MRLSAIVPFGLLCAGVIACGSKTPDPNDPSQMQPTGGYGQYPAGQYPPGQYNPGTPGTNPGTPGTNPGTPGTNPGTPGTNPGASGGGSATPIAPAAAAAATPVLQAMAANEVKGMQPDGGAFAGQFQQGQTLEQPFNIQPGKCYSVVGVGIGITQLDIQIQAQATIPGMPPVTLAQSNGSGPNATLGGGGNCFKNPLPIGGPAKVVVKATAGSGIALAQIFSK
jgi:hypothetical protein